jgi:hypothetical protein
VEACKQTMPTHQLNLTAGQLKKNEFLAQLKLNVKSYSATER